MCAAAFLVSASGWAAAGTNEDRATPDEVEVTLPARIDALVVHGLWLTKKHVVVRELPWRAGSVVTPSQFQLGITRLWNLGLFGRVSGRVLRIDGKNVGVIDLDERFPIRPVLEFQTGGNAHWIHAGASDHDLFGRYLEAEAFFEDFNGQPGGSLWFRDARLFDRRLELVVTAARLMRDRPNYLVQRSDAHLELNGLVDDDRFLIGVHADLLRDDFFEPLTGSVPALPATVNAVVVEPALRVGRIDTIRLRYTGFSFEIRPALGDTSVAGAPTFARLWFEGDAQALAGTRWNFGARTQFGTVTDHPDEMQFFLGGLDFVRGYPDNYLQANALLGYNVNARYVLFDSTWLAAVPEVFADGAAARRANGATDAIASAGVGVMFVIPKLVDSMLRVDFAVPFRSSIAPGINMGTALFF
jgi:hypothetical protein